MTTERFTPDSIPHKPQTIRVREVAPATYLLLDPDTPNWVVVDKLGNEIVAMCDGEKTLKEIIAALCEKYEGSYEESAENVLAFANEIREKYFLREEPFPPLGKVDKENVKIHELWINVTNKCNLRCIHCHLSAGVPLEDELTTEEICGIFSQAEEMGVEKITISGGEPLVRDDISSLLEYAHEHIGNITFITNGTLITEEVAEKLSEWNVKVQVSLDGAHEETQDFIRGKGSYKRTLSGLQKLIKAGAHVGVGMTLMKKNINEMHEMVKLVKKLGMKSLHFPVLQLKGRAQEYESLVRLDNEDIVAAIKEMRKISEAEGIEITVERNLRSEIEAMGKKDSCGAGSSIVSIAANGNVYPCAGLHEDEFCAGNIRKQRLEDIHRESEILRKFRVLSVLDIPECKTCDLKFICGGGCHVDTYGAYGRLDKPTPKCESQQRIYWHLLHEKMKEIQ